MMGDSNMVGMFIALGFHMRKPADGQLLVCSHPLNSMTRLKGLYSGRDGLEIMLQVVADCG